MLIRKWSRPRARSRRRAIAAVTKMALSLLVVPLGFKIPYIKQINWINSVNTGTNLNKTWTVPSTTLTNRSKSPQCPKNKIPNNLLFALTKNLAPASTTTKTNNIKTWHSSSYRRQTKSKKKVIQILQSKRIH